jgi:hypothetical protein
MVAPYDPSGHAGLIAAPRSGSAMVLDIGYTHEFGLKGSAAEIGRSADRDRLR